jgi:hypothetical protein
MKKTASFLFVILAVLIIPLSCRDSAPLVADPQLAGWPELTITMKPWTRWWWMGNAVDKENVSRQLAAFAEAGIGGVEITPIYGTRGYEGRFLDHLSKEWMDMLVHTLEEAERLGMGVDMILGTGWPYGGPQVERQFAAGKLYLLPFGLKKGESFSRQLTAGKGEHPELAKAQYLFAFDSEGGKRDLTHLLEGNRVEWTADRDCQLYAVLEGRTGQQVKRSAPGGEGFVLDHFSREALEDYLMPYTAALGPARDKLRAIFNDSYEVYHADYTPAFFDEFQRRRGYDLSDHLPVLQDPAPGEQRTRIISDYRLTLADLVLEDFSLNWAGWAREQSFESKYQAHGCPGNLIDLYAAADIPECESFYGTQFDIPGFRWDTSDANRAYPDRILFKFASSAANLAGKPLTSSETFTWLREHFKTALSQCKPEVEQLFLAGVNHTFFHGSTYSPEEAGWPGWKFYASVNFMPDYAIWRDAPEMFRYISRCQSLLQSGRPDNELLVYWPFYDVLEVEQTGEHAGEILLQLGIDNKEDWLVPAPFYRLVSSLIDQGYSVDFISDSFLSTASGKGGDIQLPGGSYRALIIPDCRNMPLQTFGHLARLHEEGARVVFAGLPESVPGFHRHVERTAELQKRIGALRDGLAFTREIQQSLSAMGLERERLVDRGLGFVRRALDDGKVYYLVNHSPRVVEGFVPFGTEAKSVILLDPQTGASGLARIRNRKTGTEVFLQLQPGQAMLIRTLDNRSAISGWDYYEKSGDPLPLKGPWEVRFLSGGPELPGDIRMEELKSWTAYGPEAEAFSGTARYTIRFEHPDPSVDVWLLQLGDVRESARVSVNGEYAGCCWSNPFEVRIGPLQEGINTLEIEVTNLSANRLRDLERSGKEWKIFYEINMVNRHYTAFDATRWDPMPSGLLGEVRMIPLQAKSF